MSMLFVALMALALTIQPSEERVSAEVTFCNFALPRNVKMGHANFNVVYSFELNEDGQPIKITKVKDEHIGEATVRSCLAGWRFQGIEKGAHMAVMFQWQHGDGWTELSITGPAFSQKIKVSGDRCPYLRM